MTKTKLFLLSFLLTLGGMTAYIYAHYVKNAPPQLKQVADGLYITSQLKPDDVPALKGYFYRTIVDIRPDGEEAGQPSSQEIERAAKENDMGFHYIPVPHEDIPDNAVTALRDVLTSQTAPTVLYCRSGRRAVRTFALVEASRTDGPDCDAITKMVKNAGFSADDLQDNIRQRIAQRNKPPTEQP